MTVELPKYQISLSKIKKKNKFKMPEAEKVECPGWKKSYEVNMKLNGKLLKKVLF